MRSRSLPATWLIGKKVRLRPLEVEDVPLLARFGLPLQTRGTVYIVQTRAGRDIGALGFFMRGRQAAIGLNLESKSRWTDGCAADAIGVMRWGALRSQPLVRIEALVRVDEPIVLAAYRKAGFVKEGVLRGAIPAGDEFKDATIVSVIAHG